MLEGIKTTKHDCRFSDNDLSMLKKYARDEQKRVVRFYDCYPFRLSYTISLIGACLWRISSISSYACAGELPVLICKSILDSEILVLRDLYL